MAKRDTYLDPATLPFPFCPGCGHGTIIEKIDEALVRRGVDPGQLVVVSDIGCSGLSDKYFATNAFHGLHGRSVTYATGIKAANPALEVVVLMGDGGCGIGGHHLINAARRNVGVTVVVFNNLNYGMTGGEHSVSTPPEAVTATTPLGQLERPMDICGTVAVNGASFVARTSTFDPGITDLLVAAMDNDGFSLVDVWELCTAYFAPANKLNRAAVDSTIQGLGFSTGVLVDQPRAEYCAAYRAQHSAIMGQPTLTPSPIATTFAHAMDQPLRMVVAGAAGKKIVSAVASFARAGLSAGLWASQRNDYPVTVKTGHVVSELILSPSEVLYSGVPRPDVVMALFPEGFKKVRGTMESMGPEGIIYLEASLPDVETRARVVRLDLASVEQWGRRKESWALMGLGRFLHDTQPFPPEALEESVGSRGELGEQLRLVVRAGGMVP
jgi:pyruvate/2-oxoacid:ferredoxin oxidoreductase beta subunit